MDKGWSDPPYDPLDLAKHLQIDSIPNCDIDDARIVPLQGSSFRIEYNPNRPPARVRYSIAHEIAHYFFPDCIEAIRNRSKKAQMTGDERQLEMLCNLGAAEVLMPIGSFETLKSDLISIDYLMEMRKTF